MIIASVVHIGAICEHGARCSDVVQNAVGFLNYKPPQERGDSVSNK